MKRLTTAALLLVVGFLAWLAWPHAPERATATPPNQRVVAAPNENRASKIAFPLDGVSPLADSLNAPAGTIRRELEILDEVLAAWQTNFPHEGNPVGENAEITAALAGENKLRFAFVAPHHPAINARGELCDRWGTPFFFHALSGTQMEIRSAGPDKKMWTGDDVVRSP